MSVSLCDMVSFLLVLEKLCVSLLYSHTIATLTTLLSSHMCEIFPTTSNSLGYQLGIMRACKVMSDSLPPYGL